MPHIEVHNVSLTYDTPAGSVPGVAGVSFDMDVSEFLCLVGPSGCGKTTLLNIIAGFLSPTGGEIRIGGKAVTGHGMDRGIVFQDFAQLFPWRTALGNVAFGLEMKGVPKAEREEIALAQLKLVKLEKFAHAYPQPFSAPDGRAVRGTRRAHARRHAAPACGSLAGDQEDGDLCDAQRGGSRVSCGSRDRHDAAPGESEG
jgi:ABC-type taurine transport system ATPase subunit